MRRLLAVVAVAAMAVVGCAEDVDVSRDEAIEVLVLDGVPRDRAVCIVDGATGVLSYAKLTGVEPEITSDELADLAGISAQCTVVDDTSAGVVSGDSGDLDTAEGGGLAVDIDAEVERLIASGLAPRLAECVGEALESAVDPSMVTIDESFITEAIRFCAP